MPPLLGRISTVRTSSRGFNSFRWYMPPFQDGTRNF
jgi:hypothetical protein